MSLNLSFFGEPLITKDGEAVSLPFKKAEALLFYLAAEKSAPKEKIAFLLWGDKNEKQAAGSLRNALCLLRRSFPGCVDADKKEIRLAGFTTDAVMIDKLASPSEPLPQEIFREPLSGFDTLDRPEFGEWLGETRAKLRERTAAALRDRITACYDAEDSEKAAEALSALLFFEPYEEESVLELMEIYRDEGVPSKAVSVYNSYRERLRSDLGMEPSERARDFLLTMGRLTDAAKSPGEFFCGREREMRRILALAQSGGEAVDVIFIHGEGGVGKTALVEQAVRTAFAGSDVFRASPLSVGEKFPYSSWDGVAAAMGAACAGRGIEPPASVRAMLSSVFYGFMDGQNPVSAAFSPEKTPLSVGRALAALAQELCAGGRPVFIFEDLHWFDDRSLSTLRVFLSELRIPAVIFMTARPESAAPAARMIYNIKPQARVRTLELALAPFGEKEIMSYCRSFLPEEVISCRGEEYFIRESEGMPLLLAEMMRILMENENADCRDGLKGLIMSRLEGMSEAERSLVLALSAFGGGAQPEELAAALSESLESTEKTLDALLQKKMIREVNDGGRASIDFLHANVRDCLYDSMPAFRRRQLHAKIAGVLASRWSPHVWNPALSAKLRHHYTMAGMKIQVLRQNISEMLFHINLNHILFPMMEDAVLLQCSVPFSSREETEEKLEEIRATLGVLRGSCPEDEKELTALEASYFELYGGYLINWGEYGKGMTLLSGALKVSSENGLDETYIHAMEDIAHYYLQTDEGEKLKETGEAILALSRRMGKENHAGLALRFLGMAKQIEGDFDGAERIFMESVKVFEDLALTGRHYTLNMLAPKCYIGEMRQRRGEAAEALRRFEECVGICEERGLFWGRSHFHAHAADAAFDMGDRALFEAHVRKGAKLFESSKGGHCTSLLYSLKAICDADAGDAEAALDSLKKADFLSAIGKKSWHAAQYMAKAWVSAAVADGRLPAEPFSAVIDKAAGDYAKEAARAYEEIGAFGRSRFIEKKFLKE
ncbi:AAA family ATPase [Cloacibacillus sp. An23]|uniref:AAA family ATPase n=1 Tax=Cloacibacillus sp. An23 TaxID=1965591 RepID=UPI000B380B92|nr:AAA family ATPase [Cloacibacillus sp. An23]OUO95088.1 hypothetical protein B5F39_00720 [Cloacibacillus sp. An23]